MSIPDQLLRERALDPLHSFIVQAPAGSGKTELLTQRFLRLLSCVPKAPEQIIAITFTRKAANEMRARIITALEKAANQPEPSDSHAKATWHLGRTVLQRDHQENWQLLNNPNRLKIHTIDALCSSLARQLSLATHFIANASITDDAHSLYQQAARETLAGIENDYEWTTALNQLLLHLDNDFMRVENLIVDMLAKREQWLPYIMNSHQQFELRAVLQQGLAEINQECLSQLSHHFPLELGDELVALFNFAAENLQQDKVNSVIAQCPVLKTLPTFHVSDKMQWLAIAELLLTKDQTWRKLISVKNGFPVPSQPKDRKTYFSRMKKRMEELILKLSAAPALLTAFQHLISSPPFQYSEQQWQILNALIRILPVAVAHLKTLFQETQQVDFSEVSQAALLALGEAENPTQLALMLDYQIQHILVDEFQDTSLGQFRLLEQLTAGWQAGDGRTLFVVGDPMQSIYRFRQAEVGLFLRAKHHGIGSIFLEPIILSANFRSQSKVVNWINETFKDVFPQEENIASGAVPYAPSLAVKPGTDEQAVYCYAFAEQDKEAQATTIASLIQQMQSATPKDSIAILVQARSHLPPILAALKSQGIHYQAVEIEGLGNQPVVQDLFALTRALLHPADRIAWLAVLRSPWCGLTLHDLYLLAGNDTTATLWQRITTPSVISQLSQDGQQRIIFLKRIFTDAFAQRQRSCLRQWINNTWISLHGPACLNSYNDWENAQTYFQLLDNIDRAGDIKDLALLEKKLSQLYAKPDLAANSQLQVMTIHKAKGLEFDHVILPSLERNTAIDKNQLLLWFERPRSSNGADLLLAPIKATDASEDPVYQYLRGQEKLKSRYEEQRLLYVAATRAKETLHLFGHMQLNEAEGKAVVPGNSLLGYLEKYFVNAMKNLITTSKTAVSSCQTNPPLFKRLPIRYFTDDSN